MTTPDALSARQRRELATALRAARIAAGLTTAKLGELLGWSQSKVSKIENQHTLPSVEDVRRWITRCAPENTTLLDEIVELTTRTRAWGSQARRDRYGVDERRRGTRDITAARVATYQSELVPGLLQTADYAQHMLRVHSEVPAAQIPEKVRARLERQDALFSGETQFDFLITETAVRWRPGPVGVTLAQLDRIATLSTQPHVWIGVISRTAQELARPMHSFVLREAGDPAANEADVEIETLTAEVSVIGPDDVARYRQFFAEQQRYATTGTELLALLRDVGAELRRRDGLA